LARGGRSGFSSLNCIVRFRRFPGMVRSLRCYGVCRRLCSPSRCDGGRTRLSLLCEETSPSHLFHHHAGWLFWSAKPFRLIPGISSIERSFMPHKQRLVESLGICIGVVSEGDLPFISARTQQGAPLDPHSTVQDLSSTPPLRYSGLRIDLPSREPLTLAPLGSLTWKARIGTASHVDSAYSGRNRLLSGGPG